MLCTLTGAIIVSINILVGLSMYLYDDIGDVSSSLRGSTFIFFFSKNLFFQARSQPPDLRAVGEFLGKRIVGILVELDRKMVLPEFMQ